MHLHIMAHILRAITAYCFCTLSGPLHSFVAVRTTGKICFIVLHKDTFRQPFRHFLLPEQCAVRRLERNEVCLYRAICVSLVLYLAVFYRLYAKCYNRKFVVLQSVNFLVTKCFYTAIFIST